jgi:hypothetical protein
MIGRSFLVVALLLHIDSGFRHTTQTHIPMGSYPNSDHKIASTFNQIHNQAFKQSRNTHQREQYGQ